MLHYRSTCDSRLLPEENITHRRQYSPKTGRIYLECMYYIMYFLWDSCSLPDFPDALLVGLVVLGEVGRLQLPGLHLEVAAAHGLVLSRESHVVRAQGVCLGKNFKRQLKRTAELSRSS
jgi:hypothetical protein